MGLAGRGAVGAVRGHAGAHHVPSDRGAAVGVGGAWGAVARLVGGAVVEGPHAVPLDGEAGLVGASSRQKKKDHTQTDICWRQQQSPSAPAEARLRRSMKVAKVPPSLGGRKGATTLSCSGSTSKHGRDGRHMGSAPASPGRWACPGPETIRGAAVGNARPTAGPEVGQRLTGASHEGCKFPWSTAAHESQREPPLRLRGAGRAGSRLHAAHALSPVDSSTMRAGGRALTASCAAMAGGGGESWVSYLRPVPPPPALQGPAPQAPTARFSGQYCQWVCLAQGAPPTRSLGAGTAS